MQLHNMEKGEQVKRMITVGLTEQDEIENGKRMSEIAIQIRDIKAQQKEITPLMAELTQLSEEIESGEREIEADCTWYIDKIKGEKFLIVDSSGVMIDSKELLPEEFNQIDMEFPEGKSPNGPLTRGI